MRSNWKVDGINDLAQQGGSSFSGKLGDCKGLAIAIRAVQGHSIDIVDVQRAGTTVGGAEASLLLSLCHGTSKEKVQSILDRGLIPGYALGTSDAGAKGRNSVHFSPYPQAML